MKIDRVVINLKIIFLGLISLILLNANIIAAKTIAVKECEYTDEYVKWLQLSPEEKNKTYMPIMCKSTNLNQYKIVGDTLSLGVSANDASFNLKDYNLLTSVKDQEDTGACWAFATNSSIESNLLTNKFGTFDLSEGHLELATQQTYKYNRLTFNRTANQGGNYLIAAAYIMNLWGPIEENKLPFQKLKDLYKSSINVPENEILNVKPAIDINSIGLISSAETCDSNAKKDIKEYLISNGALAATIYLKDDQQASKYIYYDGLSYQDMQDQQISANQAINHGITIVGWDDNISKDLFVGDNKPKNNGAWIIKNSYGEKINIGNYDEIQNIIFEALKDTMEWQSIDSVTKQVMTTSLGILYNIEEDQIVYDNNDIYIVVGNNGYQYISYEDVNICSSVFGFFDAETEIEDHGYYYDTLGFNSVYQFLDESVKEGYFVSQFTKKSSGNEELKEVAFFAPKIGQDYEVYFANGESFDFTKATKIGCGKTNFVGYTTIKVTNPPIITGSKYSILLKISDQDTISFGVTVKVPELTMYNTMEFTSGVQYISQNGKDYSDITSSSTSPAQLTIRAYTNNTTKTGDNNPSSSKDDNDPNIDNSLDVKPNDYNSEANIGDNPNVDSTINNPQTGYYIPIILLFALILIGDLLYRKGKIFKI